MRAGAVIVMVGVPLQVWDYVTKPNAGAKSFYRSEEEFRGGPCRARGARVRDRPTGLRGLVVAGGHAGDGKFVTAQPSATIPDPHQPDFALPPGAVPALQPSATRCSKSTASWPARHAVWRSRRSRVPGLYTRRCPGETRGRAAAGRSDRARALIADAWAGGSWLVEAATTKWPRNRSGAAMTTSGRHSSSSIAGPMRRLLAPQWKDDANFERPGPADGGAAAVRRGHACH